MAREKHVRVVGNSVIVRGMKWRGERNNESDESERDNEENETMTLRRRGRLLTTAGQRGLLFGVTTTGFI